MKGLKTGLLFLGLFYGYLIDAQILLPSTYQEGEPDSLYRKVKSPHWKAQKYLHFINGISIGSFKDLATSPLTYTVLAYNFAGGSSIENEKINQLSLFNANFGLSITVVEDEVYTGSFNNLEYTYHLLYQVPKLNTKYFTTKLGGAFTTTFNFRVNPHFQNAAVGFENFTNLFFSVLFTGDVSRKTERVEDWFLFKLKYLPKKRDLSLQLNLGLLNTSYRPGYAYVYDQDVTDDMGFLSLFEDYHRSYKGFRMQSYVHYTSYIKNGNAYRWSYKWDMVHAPGKFDLFQMAIHSVQYTLLFNASK